MLVKQPPPLNTSTLTLSSGPLPPPEVLAQYENITPGAAERIFFMAEKNQRIREKTVNQEHERKTRGQHYALLVVLAALGVCAFASFNGDSWTASVLGGVTVCSLAVVFVLERHPNFQAFGEAMTKKKE